MLLVSSLFLQFFFLFFKFSSGLQFIKPSSSQARFVIQSSATNLGPNPRSLWQCPEQLSRDWLERIGAGLSPCTVHHPADDRHQHTAALLPSVLALSLLMCFFFWLQRMRVQNLAAVTRKRDSLAFLLDEGCCIWISAAFKGPPGQHISCHSSGKCGMKAQVSGVHMDMPEQGQITASQDDLGGKGP